jgi:hypothetical protein
MAGGRRDLRRGSNPAPGGRRDDDYAFVERQRGSRTQRSGRLNVAELVNGADEFRRVARPRQAASRGVTHAQDLRPIASVRPIYRRATSPMNFKARSNEA